MISRTNNSNNRILSQAKKNSNLPSKLQLAQNEKIIFEGQKQLRYYLLALATILLSFLGVAYYIKIWPSRLPQFLQNTRYEHLMALSETILIIILIISSIIFLRDAKGYVKLTNQRLILSPGKKGKKTSIINLKQINSIEIGSTPFEKLSGCQSLWIHLRPAENEGYLVGPLSHAKAEELKYLLEELTKN